MALKPAFYALLLLPLATGVALAEPLRIGVVAPDAGNFAGLGAQIRAGAGFGLDPEKAVLVNIPETCEAGSGQVIAEKLVAEKVDVAIGFLCTESLETGLAELAKANIPAITLSVRSTVLMADALKRNWPLFRLAPNEDAEAVKAAEIIAQNWLGKPFALVDDGTIHGHELVEAIRTSLEEKAIKTSFVDTIRPGQDQQLTLVRRFGKGGITHVFIGGDRADIAVVARDAKSEKINLQVMGGDSLVAANRDPELPDGVQAVIPQSLGYPPSSPALAAAMADAKLLAEGYVVPAHAAVELVLAAKVDADAQSTDLTKALQGGRFVTSLGSLAFDTNHELADNPYRLAEWKTDRFVLVSAPSEGQ